MESIVTTVGSSLHSSDSELLHRDQRSLIVDHDAVCAGNTDNAEKEFRARM
jgi:hypothetical protein